jgi:hypothetical protein
MATTLDPYRDWLGITDPQRPLSLYQLLRLKKFEDDPGKVRDNYRKMNAHVRKFGSGEFAKQSQDLLNELAKAMLLLTDATRKGEYDTTLGRADKTPGKRQTLEQILLSRKLIDSEQLEKARKYASVVGLEIRDAIVQQKMAKADVVMPAYAESVGLPFLDLADITLDEALMRQVPAVLARQHSCAPVLLDDKQLLIASPNILSPDVEEELRLRTGRTVRTVLCTPAAINGVMEKYYGREAASAEIAMAAMPAAKAAPRAAAAPAAPVTAEQRAEKKQQQKSYAIVAFNFTFAMAMILQMIVMSSRGFFSSLMIGVVLAVAAAGATWVVMGKK